MTAVAYPWPWLADAAAPAFALRYPWVEAVRRAATVCERACVLVPAAAGPLADWGEWLAGQVSRDNPLPCRAAGDFRAATDALVAAYQIEADDLGGGRPADWARTFLAVCRRQMPHVETVPLLVINADDGCAAGLEDLVQAQRALGYTLVRPVLLRHTAPPDWRGEVVRFGLPEADGSLHRIEPPPDRDLQFWTHLLLALTASWEAGALPGLAEELWDRLRLGRAPSLRDPGFDLWLERQLEAFARENAARAELPLPQPLAYAPLAAVDDALWQCGAVAWQDGRFDVTPLRARLWAQDLTGDGREALRRRRLANAPLARWLSAWAASIEESLRVAVLQAGGDRFRRHLQEQPARNRRDGWGPSRWEELGPADDITAIDAADFGDLAGFVAQCRDGRRRAPPLARLLDQCRVARNRVVHERRLSSRDLLCIAGAVEWLSESGLI